MVQVQMVGVIVLYVGNQQNRLSFYVITRDASAHSKHRLDGCAGPLCNPEPAELELEGPADSSHLG